MTRRTLGIDLASADATTAACLLEWPADGAGPARLIRLEPGGVTDARILELARETDVIAIDAPLGWPVPFTDALAAYAAGGSFPGPRSDALWLRATDEHVRRLAGGRPPLSVSSDRIARPAARAAMLLTELGRERRSDRGPAARDGRDGVIEAYPAGSMRIWGLRTEGYKRPEAVAIRAGLASAIIGAAGVKVAPADLEVLAATDHALDAFVASLVGRAFQLGRVHGVPPELASLAAIEGWLFLPAGSLEELGG